MQRKKDYIFIENITRNESSVHEFLFAPSFLLFTTSSYTHPSPLEKCINLVNWNFLPQPCEIQKSKRLLLERRFEDLFMCANAQEKKNTAGKKFSLLSLSDLGSLAWRIDKGAKHLG